MGTGEEETQRSGDATTADEGGERQERREEEGVMASLVGKAREFVSEKMGTGEEETQKSGDATTADEGGERQETREEEGVMASLVGKAREFVLGTGEDETPKSGDATTADGGGEAQETREEGGEVGVMASLVGAAREFVSEKIAQIPRPEAALERVSFKSISREGITLHTHVDVSNPYSYRIPICELTYTFRSDGKCVPSMLHCMAIDRRSSLSIYLHGLMVLCLRD
jgi:hypothetical protein